MKDSVEIVHLSPQNWESYKQLRLRAIEAEPQAFGKSYKDASSEPDENWRKKLESTGSGKSWSVFAKVDGKLVGMLAATLHPQEPDRVWLHATYVEKEYRRQGIAQNLMGTILQEIAKSNAPKKIKLGVSKKQTAAVELYKKFGFKVIGEQDYVMGNGEKVREFIMEKQL